MQDVEENDEMIDDKAMEEEDEEELEDAVNIDPGINMENLKSSSISFSYLIIIIMLFKITFLNAYSITILNNCCRILEQWYF